MSWHKSLVKLVCIIILTTGLQPIHAAEAHSPAEVKVFVDNVSKSVISIVTSKSSSAQQKEDKLDDLFKDTVDIRWIGRFVVGKYWRGLSNEQKADYMELYSEYLISSYVPNFKKYNQDQMQIITVKPGDSNEYLVDTVITRPSGPEIKVSYNIRFDTENGEYKVFDIIAEGVSLIVTQRSEFGAILQRDGINYLNDQLEQKLKLANNSRK